MPAKRVPPTREHDESPTGKPVGLSSLWGTVPPQREMATFMDFVSAALPKMS